MSVNHHEANYKADPDNISYWRMSPRRLDAESIRDAILSVSGKIDLTPPKGSAMTSTGGRRPTFSPRESNNRSVYLGIPRGAPLPESLAVFDVANPNVSVSQREVTTVPVQALYLMNSPFVVEQSRNLAERLLKGPDNDAARVELAYQLAYARPPSATERDRAVHYLQQAAAGQNNATNAWASFCQAIFASAEFRYLN
jgi:hypothetical protein